MTDDARETLIDALLDQLGAERDELPDELRERLLDGMIDELIAGKRGEREILGQDGVLGEITRRMVQRALEEELTEHLGYPAGQAPPGGAGNSRNGGTPKTVLTDQGPVRIDTPRDRKSHFEPQLVKKGQRRLAGLDEKIIALYARRDDHPRDRDLHLRPVRARGQPRDRQPRHRRGAGGRQGVADPAVGADLPDPLPGRAR